MPTTLHDHHRIVVTGMSVHTPLGDTLDAFIEGLLAGRSAISHWKGFDTSQIYAKVGGDLSGYDTAAAVAGLRTALPDATWLRLSRLVSRAPFSTKLSLLLAARAMIDARCEAGWPSTHRVATLVAGHNINELYAFENRTRFDEQPDWIDALMSLNRLDTDHGGCVSELFGLRGPLYTVGGACASGNLALRLAVDEIRYRGQDAAVVIAPVLDYNPLELHAMALMGAITTTSFNDTPALASRPWDVRREGFVPSHGGGCLVLEPLSRARKRGAHIHAEVLAVDASSDANHLPNPSADGQELLMRRVLDQAGLHPDDIDYVNAHATSTPLGDVAEAHSISAVFGSRPGLKVNAPKSILGHCCWSAPTVEAIAGILQMNAGVLHRSLNIDDLAPEVTLDVCRERNQPHHVRRFLKNSFGFGGINAIAIFGRVSPG